MKKQKIKLGGQPYWESEISIAKNSNQNKNLYNFHIIHLLKDILGANWGEIEENGFVFNWNMPNRKFQFRFHIFPNVSAPKFLDERKSLK